MKLPKYMSGLKASNIGPAGQTATFVWITPRDAQMILDSGNTKNVRTLRPVRVRLYTEVMTAGEWTIGSEAIAFDGSGRLVQGQHRLTALAATDLEGLWMLVVLDVTEQDERAMDQGLARSIATTHEVNGKHAAIVRLAIQVGTGSTVSPPRHVLASAVSKYQKDLDRCHEWASKVPGGGAVVAAAGLIALIARPGNRAALCDLLGKLAELDLRTPELKVLKRWIDQHSPLSHGQAQDRMRNCATVLRGLEVCLTRETVQHIRTCDSHEWADAAVSEILPSLAGAAAE